MEAELEAAVSERPQIEERLGNPSAYSTDDVKLHAIAAKLVTKLEAQWEQLSEQLES